MRSIGLRRSLQEIIRCTVLLLFSRIETQVADFEVSVEDDVEFSLLWVIFNRLDVIVHDGVTLADYNLLGLHVLHLEAIDHLYLHLTELQIALVGVH